MDIITPEMTVKNVSSLKTFYIICYASLGGRGHIPEEKYSVTQTTIKCYDAKRKN